MKKTNIGDGGAPIINDYITILQNGTIEALAALVSSFGNNVILNGAVVSISGSTLSITEGWAFFDNEIIRIPSHSWSGTSLIFAIAYTEVVEVVNPIPYANGSSQALSKERVLKFKSITTESLPIYYSAFVSMPKSIANILQPIFVEPTIAVSGSGFTYASGVSSGGGGLSVKKRIDKTLVIDGYVNGIDVNGVTISGVPNCKQILTLDAEYRPASKVFFTNVNSLTGTYSNIPVFNYFVLFPDGQLCLIEATTPSNPEVTFNTAVITLI
jgi:hypothetical protein